MQKNSIVACHVPWEISSGSRQTVAYAYTMQAWA